MSQAPFGLDPGQGLWLFRASRLEALLEPLDTLLQQLPPASPLQPQTVLVGHPGLRGWLKQKLAERRGAAGIVANLDIELPSPWLDALAMTLIRTPLLGIRAWQREVLCWRLLALLPRLGDPRIDALLETDDGRQAQALAQRLAAVLCPLLVERGDWLSAWEQGRSVHPDDRLLARCWRALRAGPWPAHRGECLARLEAALHRAQSHPELQDAGPLHLFGLHHLPPAEWRVLRALAKRRPLALYVVDPCREHWLGMGQGRQALRRALADEDQGEAGFLALDHPLLAAWGRLGQHFLLALEDDEAAVVDVRHGADLAHSGRDDLLGRLQDSLRAGSPEGLRLPSWAAFRALAGDASLRIHRCASPLRELEILRDALTRAFAEIAGLQPADVVVMAPDPARYRALLPAVFGEPGRPDAPWPWQAADLPLVASHPLHRGLAAALELPGSRLSAQRVLELLALPELARRFALENETAALRPLLAELGIAWGLDAEERVRFAVPPDSTHTFDGGLDRALAGLVFGDRESGPIELADGSRVLPAQAIDSACAERLGRLYALLLELREWTAMAGQRWSPPEWQRRLARRLSSLFDPGGDATAIEAMDTLQGLLAELFDDIQQAGLDAPLPWPVVQSALRQRLEAVPARQRFLTGGISFCAMVPQRAIPFRVVAVLGLDEGALPRRGNDDGLDLRARAPRPGDRDLASDDRYLFLETLLAARDRLHLSYQGIDARDGRPRNAASPLCDLQDTLSRFVPPAAPPDHDQPIDPSPWLHSASLLPDRPRAIAATAPPRPTPQPAAARPTPSAAVDGPARIEELCAFFRDPARHLLRDLAGVRLHALEDLRLADSEPLEPLADRRERLALQLVEAALQGSGEPPEHADERWRLRARLPPGRLGESAWAREAEQARQTLAALRTLPDPPAEPLLPARPRIVSIELGEGRRLEGRIEFHEDALGRCWLLGLHPGSTAKALHLGQQLPLLLRWHALRLGMEGPLHAALVGKQAEPRLMGLLAAEETRWQQHPTGQRLPLAARLRDRLQAAIAFRAAVLAGSARYHPAISTAALRHGEEAIERIAETWQGSEDGHGERDRAPGYNALWGRDWRFEPEPGMALDFLQSAQRLARELGLAAVDAGYSEEQA